MNESLYTVIFDDTTGKWYAAIIGEEDLSSLFRSMEEAKEYAAKLNSYEEEC